MDAIQGEFFKAVGSESVGGAAPTDEEEEMSEEEDSEEEVEVVRSPDSQQARDRPKHLAFDIATDPLPSIFPPLLLKWSILPDEPFTLAPKRGFKGFFILTKAAVIDFILTLTKVLRSGTRAIHLRYILCSLRICLKYMPFSDIASLSLNRHPRRRNG